MSNIVRDAIAEELALLTKTVRTPKEPFGYGTDLSCESDIDVRMTEVNGLTTLALAQALVRRLDCPRGALPDDPDYGIDLRSYCNRGMTTADVRALAGTIRVELEKDDRVDLASVTVTPSPTATELSVRISITPIDARIGGFTMTLAVDTTTIMLEEMRG